MIPSGIPRYLRRKSGALAAPSRRIADLFACGLCGAELERAETGWCCSRHLHGKLIPDAELVERLARRFAELGHRRRNAERTMKVQRRAWFFRRRQANGTGGGPPPTSGGGDSVTEVVR